VAVYAAVAAEIAALVEHGLAADADIATHAIDACDPVREVAEGLAALDAGLVRGLRFRRRVERAVRHPVAAQQPRRRDAGGRLHALGDVGEAQLRVLLPDPVGRQR